MNRHRISLIAARKKWLRLKKRCVIFSPILRLPVFLVIPSSILSGMAKISKKLFVSPEKLLHRIILFFWWEKQEPEKKFSLRVFTAAAPEKTKNL